MTPDLPPIDNHFLEKHLEETSGRSALAPNPIGFEKIVIRVDDEEPVQFENVEGSIQQTEPEKIDNSAFIGFLVFALVGGICFWVFIFRLGRKWGWW